MLKEQEIRQALHGARVLPLGVANPHGPLGLEQLKAAVSRLPGSPLSHPDWEHVRRPIALPLPTWEKLENLAQATSRETATEVSAGDLAAAIIEQYMTSVER
jgi:hypothetical protein